MLSLVAQRLRSSSLSSVAPRPGSCEFDPELFNLATEILYRSPSSSPSGLPIFVLNAAAFPDANEIDFNALLPYVLARLPDEEELLEGRGYELVFFAGGGGDGPTAVRKARPGWGWFVQAYNVLTRATRKRLQRLYIVHERSWVRVLVELFSTIVSPKFRRKIVHVSTLSGLSVCLPLEDLLIPPSAYLHDRRLSPQIQSPNIRGRRAFNTRAPLPSSSNGRLRLPRVLREASSFVLMIPNVQAEGIFRISAHSKLLDILREAYSRGQKWIIWKEGGTYLPPQRLAWASAYHTIEEFERMDGYGVHLAAGLIKLWYRELREPLFPSSSYLELKRIFGNDEESIDQVHLIELLSSNSQWSILPEKSRQILIRHLIPLLSRTAAFQDHNQMSPRNLAICFSATLLRGTDPIEDARMNRVIQRLVEAAVLQWDNGLREACGVRANEFTEALQTPSDDYDYEDPAEEDEDDLKPVEDRDFPKDEQLEGILLRDNDVAEEEEGPRPPLPPRPNQVSLQLSSAERPAIRVPGPNNPVTEIKRKPAPHQSVPPQQSTVTDPRSSLGPEWLARMAESTNAIRNSRHRINGSMDSSDFEGSISRTMAATATEAGRDAETIPTGKGAQISLTRTESMPRRKALTAEQANNATRDGLVIGARTRSQSAASLSGQPSGADTIKRKPVQLSVTTHTSLPSGDNDEGKGQGQHSPSSFATVSPSLVSNRTIGISPVAREITQRAHPGSKQNALGNDDGESMEKQRALAALPTGKASPHGHQSHSPASHTHESAGPRAAPFHPQHLPQPQLFSPSPQIPRHTFPVSSECNSTIHSSSRGSNVEPGNPPTVPAPRGTTAPIVPFVSSASVITPITITNNNSKAPVIPTALAKPIYPPPPLPSPLLRSSFSTGTVPTTATSPSSGLTPGPTGSPGTTGTTGTTGIQHTHAHAHAPTHVYPRTWTPSPALTQRVAIPLAAAAAAASATPSPVSPATALSPSLSLEEGKEMDPSTDNRFDTARRKSAPMAYRPPSELLSPPPPLPGKLRLGKGSVDNLRRLYEERAGAASSLVAVGVSKQKSFGA